MCLRRLVAVALTALAFCAWPALGDEHPVIEEVSLMEMPGDVQTPTALNIVVTLRGDAVPGPALGDVTVAVQYRVMFCVQQNASLARLSADTNIWHGSLSSSGGRNISTGDLFQYRVLLATAGAVVDADPPGLDNNNATRMHTWIVGFGEIFNSSAVPPLLWYTQDFERSRWDYPTPGAFAFADGGGKLHYYSASEVHREGSGRKDGPVKLQSQELKSKDWIKRKFKVTFHDKHFHWPGTSDYQVKRLNLRSMYVESGPVSYLREAMALKTFKEAGVPCADWFYVRLYVNGRFYGLYLITEDLDRRWLARRGFSNATLLIKTNHWKYANLRAPDPRLDCPQTAPDQDYRGKGHGKARDCPMVYDIVNPQLQNSWDRLYDNVLNNFSTSLQQVVDRVSWAGPNDSFVQGFWDLRVNVGEVINEMAVQTLIFNVDRCAKNHYIFRTPDARWGLIPYDVEDAFATDFRSNHLPRSCAAQGWACRDAGCLLSCGEYNSISLCDRTHPQDAIERSTYNHLVDGILYNPPLRARYLARLRQLTDLYSNSGWLEREIRNIAAYIAQDATADMLLWKISGTFEGNVAALISQVQTRRGQLYDQLKAASG